MKRKFKSKRFTSDYRKLLFSHVGRSSIRLIAMFTNSDDRGIGHVMQVLREKIRRWTANGGLVNLCKRIKESEKSYLLTGKTSWFSLKHLKKYGVSDEGIKTLFTIHRNMKVDPVPNFQSIRHISPSWETFISKDGYLSAFEAVCKAKRFQIPSEKTMKWCADIRQKTSNNTSIYTAECPPVDCNNRTGGHEAPLRVNTKSGPNGPTLGSQKKDLCALKHKEPHLIECIRRMWNRWGYVFDENQYDNSDHDGGCECVASKLHALSDKSCKTRVVAMIDSYSQVSLRPVHKMISYLLMKLKTDFTRDHSKGVQVLSKKDGELFSIDLSNATDTLPVYIAAEFLKRNTPVDEISDVEQFVKDTMSLMTDRDFMFRDMKVRYNTGQPMGAYASFPMLALTNHIIVNMAKVLCGLNPDGCGYAIVGDDIVISGRNIAEKYIEVLTALGVPINHSKMVEGFRTFEFCRRIVRDGKIVSAPSWNAYFQASVSKDPSQIILLAKAYGRELPSYGSLRQVFKPRHLRTLLALNEDLHLHRAPRVRRIPHDIVAHADRVLATEDSIKSGLHSFESDDPYLKRLSYALEIYRIYTKSIKKYGDLWNTCLKVRANYFYLNYVRTYLERKKFISRSYNIMSENSHNIKLRELCMSKRKLWMNDQTS